MKMNILLINPPYMESVYSGVKSAVQVQIPLGLAYIASALERDGHSVDIIDANAEGLDIDATVEKVRGHSADVVGITCTSMLVGSVGEIADEIKKLTCKKVVVGGPHVTFFPEGTLKQYRGIDLVVRGEGEDTVRELAGNGFDPSMDIKGIAFRGEDGSIVITQERDRIMDLDDVPFPARHLFNMRLYRPGSLWNTGVKDDECMTIITSRGCPSRCSYCASLHFWGPKVRFRSVDNIINEIEFMVREYSVKQIGVLDDTFLANQKRVSEFCDKLLDGNIKIRWWCYARLDRIYPKELFRKMKRAGCFGLSFGVESGNQNILDVVGKNIKIETVKTIIHSAKEEGFMIQSSFMIGLPGDTFETVKETIDFSIKLNPHVAQFCITTPFPGTELYKTAKEKGVDGCR